MESTTVTRAGVSVCIQPTYFPAGCLTLRRVTRPIANELRISLELQVLKLPIVQIG
jgi:hypothetical protein